MADNNFFVWLSHLNILSHHLFITHLAAARESLARLHSTTSTVSPHFIDCGKVCYTSLNNFLLCSIADVLFKICVAQETTNIVQVHISIKNVEEMKK